MRILFGDKDINYDLVHIELWDWSDYKYQWVSTSTSAYRKWEHDEAGKKIIQYSLYRIVAIQKCIKFRNEWKEEINLEDVIILCEFNNYEKAREEFTKIYTAYNNKELLYFIE